MIEYLILAIIVASFIFGTAWLKTGRSPFWLAAVAFLHLEAARQQALASIVFAARHFVDGYRNRYESVRRDVLEPVQ